MQVSVSYTHLVEIENGALYETEIFGIEKGSAGNPGVMAGVIYYGPGSRLGSVKSKTGCGVFGTVEQAFWDTVKQPAAEVGHRQDVKRGTDVYKRQEQKEQIWKNQ